MIRLVTIALMLALSWSSAGGVTLYSPTYNVLPDDAMWDWEYNTSDPSHTAFSFHPSGLLELDSTGKSPTSVYEYRYTTDYTPLSGDTYFMSIDAKMPSADQGFYMRFAKGNRAAYFRLTPERVDHLMGSTLVFHTLVTNTSNAYYDPSALTTFRVVFHSSAETYDLYANHTLLGSGPAYNTGLPHKLIFGDGDRAGGEHAQFGAIRWGAGTGTPTIPEPGAVALLGASLGLFGLVRMLRRN